MTTIVVLLFFAGVLMVTVGYVNQLHKCPPARIEYRYVPRTFQEEQENPIRVSQLFNNMFQEPSPWIGGFSLSGNPTKNAITNKYFISQS